MGESEWPQNGDTFYWVRSDTGDICESKFYDNSQSCRFRLRIGNIFRSQLDAQKAKMRQMDRVLDKKVAQK